MIWRHANERFQRDERKTEISGTKLPYAKSTAGCRVERCCADRMREWRIYISRNPESAPTGLTLEAPGVRELNDTAKQSVMTGYEGMISDLSMNKEEDSKLPEGVVDGPYSRAYIYNLYKPTQHNVDVGVSDVTDGREKDEDGKSRFWDNTLRIRASEEDPHNELR